jgi:hypothetical protein
LRLVILLALLPSPVVLAVDGVVLQRLQMRSTPASEASPDNGQAALEGLTTGAAIVAWIVIAILLFTALAIAATLYAANKRRKLEYAACTQT